MLVFRAPPDSSPPGRILIYRDVTENFPLSLDRLIGQTLDLSFTDYGLVPGKRYYYRCASYDAFGRKQGESQVKSVRTPGILFREGEAFYASVFHASCSLGVHLSYNEDGKHDSLPHAPKGVDTLFGNARYLEIFPKAAGDSASFLFYVPAPDTFDLAMAYATGPGFGSFDMTVNNAAIGVRADAYADSPGISEIRTRQPFLLKAGNNLLTFRACGKTARASGYEIGIDRMSFTTLAQRYEGLPDSLKLRITGLYPNPFNPIVSIRYDIAEDGRVRGDIFDVNGRLVRTLLDKTQARRNYIIQWDGTNNGGQACPSGIYFVRIRTGALSRTVMAVLAR
jgi:hypothetical protein